jgi:hypothetical protein
MEYVPVTGATNVESVVLEHQTVAGGDMPQVEGAGLYQSARQKGAPMARIRSAKIACMPFM